MRKILKMKKVMKQIIEKIEKAENILLSSHLGPDGDNIGSLIGLGYSLMTMKKQVTILQLDEVPNYLKFLKGFDIMTDTIPKNVDLYITLDCANKDRLGNVECLLTDPNITIINIDHHKSNELYGHINLIKDNYSSTCEVVYDLLKFANFNIPIESANALFTGICTDTGRFLYPAANSNTLKAASELLEQGADKRKIMYHLYENISINAKKLQIDILSKAEFHYNSKAVITFVTMQQVRAFDTTISEVDEVVNEYKNASGVELSVFIKQKEEGLYKISLRSKEYLDVNEIASTFGGGGHKHAAGCSIKGDLEGVKNMLIERLDQIEWKS